MPSFMDSISGRQILLNVIVGPPGTPADGTEAVKALVDTGATISGVVPGLVERLGLENTGEWITLGGAHGPKDVATYEISLGLPIADHPGAPAFIRGATAIRVAELELSDSAGFEVVLGMDFLQPFHLTIHRDTFILSN